MAPLDRIVVVLANGCTHRFVPTDTGPGQIDAIGQAAAVAALHNLAGINTVMELYFQDGDVYRIAAGPGPQSRHGVN